MNIEKAIEILSDILHHVKLGDPPEIPDALKLGIEALKAVKAEHILYGSARVGYLPGEDGGE